MRATVVVLAALLALAACTGKYKPSGTAGAVGQPGSAAGTPAASGPPADCEDQTGGDATLTVSDFSFHPACLRVSAGSDLRIVNEDASAHSFTVSGGAIDETLEANSTDRIRSLGGLAPGTYAFNCRFHPPMTGTLIVE